MTTSGLDSSPNFSDDGQRIFFYRGARGQNRKVYTINADGSQEKVLVPGSQLAGLGLGYDESTESGAPEFVSDTHQLLFQTYQPDPVRINPDGSPQLNSNQDLLLLDMDNGKVKRLLPPGQASFFQVSPDSKKIWVLSVDHLDLIGLDGKFIRHLEDYPPALPDTFIMMPNMYWSRDSSRLSLILPPAKSAIDSNGPEAKTIWQALLDDSRPLEIHLNPPPVDTFSISPNGNWIAYSYCCLQRENEQATPYGSYIGNLREGTTQPIDAPGMHGAGAVAFYWSPDNTHFIFHDMYDYMYLGDLHGKSEPLNGGGFLGWIDNTRYLYGNVVMGEIGKEVKVLVVDLPAGIKYINPEYFTYVFVKSKAKK